MLTRAARRRHNLRYIQHAAEQIQLPWLCPALARTTQRHEYRRPITSRPAISRSATNHGPVSQSRNLASAATGLENFDSNDDYIPFSYPSSSLPRTRTPFDSISALPQFDMSKILVIDDTTALPPDRIETNRKFGVEVRGNAEEVEATLQACLQVQRWDRAFALLAQLDILYQSSPIKRQQIYNQVFRTMCLDAVYQGQTRNSDKINNWIEVVLQRAGVQANAETYAWKIKVALSTLSGSKRDRTVRRYWELAKQADFQNEVASLRHILNDNDLGKLTRICPLKLDFPLQNETTSMSDIEVSAEGDVLSTPSTTILQTEQKGLGLSSLHKSLSLFDSEHQPEEVDQTNWTKEQKESYAVQRQIHLEKDALEASINRWKIEHDKLAKMGVAGGLAMGRTGALLWQWHEILTKKVVNELKLVAEAEAKDTKTEQDKLRCDYGPFLRLLEPDRLAALTTVAMMSVMSKIGVTKTAKLSRVVVEVGKIVENESEAQLTAANKAKRKALGSAQPQSASQNFMEKPRWSSAIQAKVGAILCEHLFDAARMMITKKDNETGKCMSIPQPVFIYQTLYQTGRKIGAVSVHEDFVTMMLSQPPGATIVKQLPMVAAPKPWTGYRDGAYYESKTNFLRMKNGEFAQRDYAQAAAARGDLDQLFAAVDVLGRTAWKINSDVFGVMVQAWNSGEEVANLPPLHKAFAEPSRPAEGSTAKERAEFYRKMREIENEKSGLHSNRCFINFQMEIAKAYSQETFYLPHNIDFRGRAYPIPPYLNQMGADNARGLLVFAKGRKLGADGLHWLQIHLANVFGYDKASLSDRAQFAVDHLDDIRDSVNNPLSGRRWWLKAEDPWQCLATSFELTKALDSAEPTEFVSHMPIHQDGSCNGLQHYAALGGDVAGAKQVNLEPGDRPADVYTGVCELVKAEVKIDAENGEGLAKMLDGHLTRKIVKQTVMTNVYGVTFLGAVRQVRKQIDDLMPHVREHGLSGKAAAYIAKKIFQALGKMFNGAHDIQYWLGDCANRVSLSLSPAQLKEIEAKELSKSAPTKSQGVLLRPRRTKKKSPPWMPQFRSTMIWTTPLKLPVVQPYRDSKARQVQTNLQGITLNEPSVADSVNKRKQLQAFPPNFIHSLDATHMALSALKADELGLTFSAVHDSFWTHAADVNTLNSLLRDAFIRMHSEDIIGRLAAEFKARYKGHLYLAQVGRNNQVARAIQSYRLKLAKEHGISGGGLADLPRRKHLELLREIKKRRLLESDKPEEREEGEKMESASTIYARLDGDSYLHAKDSLGETAIGKLPKEADEAAIQTALNSEEAKTNVDMKQTLDPLIDESHDAEQEQEGEHGLGQDKEQYDATEKSSGEKSEKTIVRKKAEKGKGSSVNQTIWLWLPLTIKPIPKRGDWDITRIKDSQYFFS